MTDTSQAMYRQLFNIFKNKQCLMPEANTKAKKMICVTTGIVTIGALFGIVAYNRGKIFDFFKQHHKVYIGKPPTKMIDTFKNSLLLQIIGFLLVTDGTVVSAYLAYKSGRYFYTTVTESNKCCNIVRCAARTTVMVPTYMVISLIMTCVSYLYLKDICALIKLNNSGNE